MNLHAFRRIAKYMRPYRGFFAACLLVSFVEIGAESSIPLLTMEVIDGPIAEGDSDRLWPVVGLIVLLAGVVSILAYARRMTAAKGSQHMENDMRNELYAHLQRLHVPFHDSWQSGQLLSRAIYDINSIRRYVGFGLMFLIICSVQFVVIVVLMVRLNPLLAAITALGLLPIGWVSHAFGSRYRVVSRRVQDEQGDLTTIIEESATGIRIIKAFGRGGQMLRKFRKQAMKVYDSNVEQVRLRAFYWPLFDLAPIVVLGAVLLVGGLFVLDGSLSLGGLAAFIAYVNMLIWPVDALGWILAMGHEARTAIERLYEVFDTQPVIEDRPRAGRLDAADGRIALEGVWFRYSEERDWVLRDVDLMVEPGETLALVGKTGCGKTSLAMLVPRLYDATEGRVRLDGNDVAELTLRSLRSHIGVAFEDPILFSASVRENLVMGRPDASDDEIAEALTTAQADFVYELPWGLDTRVGEQGHTLSGGQRQRLALARAVLGKPSVLVLDDPLSSVDVHTEALIEEALERVLKGVTALLVVHRPSTLALADRVVLLDGGTIAAVGTHHELMETNTLYRAVLSQEAEDMEARDPDTDGGRRPRYPEHGHVGSGIAGSPSNEVKT